MQACRVVDDFELKLVVSVMELGFLAKIFGYSKRVYLQTSIIYGVFRDDAILYAVEIQNLKIVQAKATMNAKVSVDDMKIIQNGLVNLVQKTINKLFIMKIYYKL